MRLRFRIFWLFLTSFWKKPLELQDESVLNLRVLINDTDITKVSTDRYVALMDLGRVDFAFRVGLRGAMVKKLWGPLAMTHSIRFRYPLKIFQNYQLITKVMWWSDYKFYFEQIFKRNDRVLATGYVSATLMNKTGPIPSIMILKEIGNKATKPEEPDIIARLRKVRQRIHKTQID